MSNRYDVIVLGVGTMGSATCHHLAKRGVRVLGLERFDIPHERGAMHGFSRVIRQAYFEHPDYVGLLLRAYQLWNELERESGRKVLHITGGLYMGAPDGEVIAGSLASARQHGLPHEVLDHAAVSSRYPQFQLPPQFIGFFETRAGFLAPELAVAAHAERALRLGAEMRGREAVVDWRADHSGVTVRTDKGTYHADQLLICGGAWSGRIIQELGVPLTVTRQVAGWVWPRNPEPFTLGTLPIWNLDPNPRGQYQGTYYGFPMMPDNPGFKLALHYPLTPTDPDNVNRDVLPGDEETFRKALRDYIPDADGPLLALRTCLYTNTPDGHFILDAHPNPRLSHGRVHIACGFSGHGFKFATVVGEIMADLATRGQTDLSIDFLRLKRFA